MSGDDYVEVTAMLRWRTEKAVLLDVGESVSRGAWVPRSCLHGADDLTIDKVALDSEITVRIREWIAEKNGLI